MARTYQHERATSRSPLDGKAALWAGLIAGAVFMIMEMTLVAVAGGGSFWGPPRMIGAMALGRDVLPPPATFDAGVVMVAMIIHFVLSLIYAYILAWVIERLNMTTGTAALLGAAFGLVIYAVNFYAVAPALFPWFEQARTWITIVSHIAFGLLLGWSYRALADRTAASER